jgi:lipopolysaccharide assembly outer membrane protein LptD (OstA)
LGLNLKKGWQAIYSAHYDELNKEFQENNFSIKYSAQCWDASFDLIRRNNFINGDKQTENKIFFLVTLKGIGPIGKKRNVQLLREGL